MIVPAVLDIDGNGTTDALTDGLMLLRAMFGLTGVAVTNNSVGSGVNHHVILSRFWAV